MHLYDDEGAAITNDYNAMVLMGLDNDHVVFEAADVLDFDCYNVPFLESESWFGYYGGACEDHRHVGYYVAALEPIGQVFTLAGHL